MTPKEAVDRLIPGHLARSIPPVHIPHALALFEMVASTAKDDECRRCADRVIAFAGALKAAPSRGGVDDIDALLKALAAGMLRTGGLKVEE